MEAEICDPRMQQAALHQTGGAGDGGGGGAAGAAIQVNFFSLLRSNVMTL